MIKGWDRISADEVVKAVRKTRYQIPFFTAYVQAGFPSPAESYVERACDLNDLCIDHPEATYFVRAAGDSMTGDGIAPGDILVVDSALDIVHGKVVVVCLNGENTVKRIHLPGGSLGWGKPRNELVVLMPANPDYLPIYVQPEERLDIYGVVTFVIHKMK